MTIHWKAAEKYFTVVLISFIQFNCNFGKFVNFGLGNIRFERIKGKEFCKEATTSTQHEEYFNYLFFFFLLITPQYKTKVNNKEIPLEAQQETVTTTLHLISFCIQTNSLKRDVLGLLPRKQAYCAKYMRRERLCTC